MHSSSAYLSEGLAEGEAKNISMQIVVTEIGDFGDKRSIVLYPSSNRQSADGQTENIYSEILSEIS